MAIPWSPARLGDVLAVGVGAEADHLGMDARAARPGVLALLEDERAAPSPITRPSRSRRRAAASCPADRSVCWSRTGCRTRRPGDVELFGAAGDHHVRLANADGLVAVADRLAARGAGARCRDDAAGEAEEEADIDRRGVAHHLDVAGRGQTCECPRSSARRRRGRPRRAEGGAIGDARAPDRSTGSEQPASVSARSVA